MSTPLEIKLYAALDRIRSYQSPQYLRRHAERQWGCDADEAIEMAYENAIGEAKAALKGVRKPTP